VQTRAAATRAERPGGAKRRRARPRARDVLTALALATCAIATVTDVRHRRIPDALTLPAALAALAAGGHLAAGAAAAAFLGAAALARPDGMGLGDAKLAGVLGLSLGEAVATALLVALASATLYGVGVAAERGLGAARGATVPFAPFLALGALVASGVA
jgi:leader peptidase (prepilin peptidase) / N-methyltransferase